MSIIVIFIKRREKKKKIGIVWYTEEIEKKVTLCRLKVLLPETELDFACRGSLAGSLDITGCKE